ncbi:MAG: xanthine dehydrogenase family protein molybdopterin-binding subunit [Actinomycetota bacterium]|nr:xanthine dehydrogenase family protein molybdopterin-binding subunit [Actinomycetota bacterium]
MSILGTRVKRIEDPAFLTSGATYTEDVEDDRLAGALHMTFVRSPMAHASITSIDVSAAMEMDGVVAVLVADDLRDAPAQGPMLPIYPPEMAMPLLAKDVVRYVGEPVAVVLSERRYDGEDAAELVVVDYEPLPATVDVTVAAQDEILLFPDLGSNTAYSVPSPGIPGQFDACEVVVTRTIVNQRVAVAPLEGRAVAASWGDDGRLLIWCPNQGAQAVKASLQAMLGLEDSQLRLITPDVGGGFGGKFFAEGEYAVAALAAKIVGRPCRWVETRSENLVWMHGRGQVQTITIGGARDGDVTAYRLEILADAGAYPRVGAMLPGLTAMMAPGCYDIPATDVSAASVVTNTAPMNALRGAGRPEATAAIERAMDLFAAEIGMDPAEVRRRNLIAPFDGPISTSIGTVYDCGDYERALDLALEASDYAALREEQRARRERGDVIQMGIGLSVYVEVTGVGMDPTAFRENATVELHADGTATILTGTAPHGQGHATSFAMLASEQLGIPVEKFTLRWGDTDLIPEGAGTGGSRSLQQGGPAVQQATREVIEVAKRRAAEILEVDPVDLEVDLDNAGLAVRGTPQASVSFAELASHGPLLARQVFEGVGPTFPFGAHVAVVDVDVETGKVHLRRVIAVDDAGTILNPLIVEGQVHGGLAQGAEQALLGEVLYDTDGNPTTTTFADYPIVSATEVPTFELVTMETPTSYNPLGAKGVGEAGTIGVTPAIQNAVVDAVSHLGVRHIEMPTSPHRVWRAIEDAREGA